MILEATVGTNSEDERIKALKRYAILDTPPDGSFDKITKLAAKLLNVPIVIVSLVDTDRIWFKSKYGLDVDQITRDPGLCSSAILSDGIYLVEDARNDPRTLTNPLVAGEFGLQFYAAAPLKTHDGHNLGTFCILDLHPRHITEQEKETLKDLADILMEQMELRLQARTAIHHQNQLLSIAAHDLKNPITSISLRGEILKRRKNDSEAINKIGDEIKESTSHMMRIIDELLEAAKSEAGKIHLNITSVSIASVIERVVKQNYDLASHKHQNLKLVIENRPTVLADETKLAEVVDNLISNAIKYSPLTKNITVNLSIKNNKARLEVIDEGPGLTPEDIIKMFQRFTRLTAQPTNGESSTGLGLSIAKAVIDAHNGNIWAESDGKGAGSKFIVELQCS